MMIAPIIMPHLFPTALPPPPPSPPPRSCVASCDDAGVIAQWSCEGDGAGAPSSSLGPKPVATFDKGAGFPCTGLGLVQGLLVASYASGHVRIFRPARRNPSSGAASGSGGGGLLAEIAAHARCITALCPHPLQSTFATVGEDSVLNVWSVPDAAAASMAPAAGAPPTKLRVLLDMTTTVTDATLTGVQFVSNPTRPSVAHLAVASYDSRELKVFLGLGM
jgi:hypothetical protein